MSPESVTAQPGTSGGVSAAETGLRQAVLALTLALPCLLGYLTTYLLLPLAILAAVLALRRAPFRPDAMGRVFIAAFVVIAALVAINADAPADAFAALNFIALPLYVPLAMLLGRGGQPENACRVALLALLGAVLGFVLSAAQVYLMGIGRAGVLNTDPIRLANTALLLGFLAPALGWQSSAGWRRAALLVGPAVAFATVLLTGARIAMVAFPVLSFVLIVLLARRKGLAVAAASVAVLALIAIAFTNPFGSDRVASLLTSVGNIVAGETAGDEAVRIRLVLYEAGWQAFLQSPLIGHGWAGMMPATGTFLSETDKVHASLPHLHNELLTFAVFGGIVGVALYACLLAAPIVVVWRSNRDSQYKARLHGAVTLVLAYALMGATDTMLSFELHTALYVALAAVLLGYCRDSPAEGTRNG